MKYFIANWKANKNYKEAVAWMNGFIEGLNNDQDLQSKLENNQISIIICPPSPFLVLLETMEVTYKNINVGAQSISDKDSGAFTGEVTAKTIKGLAQYTILGHSERRSNYGETNDILELKTKQAIANNITPILCIRDTDDEIFADVSFVAFEPVSAIGTGNNMPIEEVIENKKKFTLPEDCKFIYGGSVNKESAKQYIQSPEIDGFLIGGASLEPVSFLEIVKQV